MEGVERVITVYTGGKKESPKHHKPHDHVEAIFIEFNPTKTSYRKILELWHECDDPWEEQTSQHRSAIFWKALSQQDAALEYVEELQAGDRKKKLCTTVERVRKVYEVEVYDSNRGDVPESPRNSKQESAEQAPRKPNMQPALHNGQKP